MKLPTVAMCIYTYVHSYLVLAPFPNLFIMSMQPCDNYARGDYNSGYRILLGYHLRHLRLSLVHGLLLLR